MWTFKSSVFALKTHTHTHTHSRLCSGCRKSSSGSSFTQLTRVIGTNWDDWELYCSGTGDVSCGTHESEETPQVSGARDPDWSQRVLICHWPVTVQEVKSSCTRVPWEAVISGSWWRGTKTSCVTDTTCDQNLWSEPVIRTWSISCSSYNDRLFI